MGIEMLGHRYVPEILLELRSNPGQSKNELATRMGHARTVHTRLDELEREGWIEYIQGPRYGAHLVVLTREGMIVADGLRTIERRL